MCRVVRRVQGSAAIQGHRFFPACDVAVAVALIALVNPPGSPGQDSSPLDEKPVFEVASLKPASPPSGRITVDLGNSSHGRLTLSNVTLSECLRFAFNI